MVTVSEVKDSYSAQDSPEEDSLREERRRTGRYVATVIAIFVSLFGLYQAMARGTPEYAAFFLPALIMFFYVLWILYASRSRGKNVSDEEKLPNEENLINLEEIIENPSPPDDTTNPKPSTSERDHVLSRSYSIA